MQPEYFLHWVVAIGKGKDFLWSKFLMMVSVCEILCRHTWWNKWHGMKNCIKTPMLKTYKYHKMKNFQKMPSGYKDHLQSSQSFRWHAQSVTSQRKSHARWGKEIRTRFTGDVHIYLVSYHEKILTLKNDGSVPKVETNLVITVTADVLAPSGATTSAGTMMALKLEFIWLLMMLNTFDQISLKMADDILWYISANMPHTNLKPQWDSSSFFPHMSIKVFFPHTPWNYPI